MFERLTRVVISLVLLLAPSLGAMAADPAGNYAIWGVGRASCHQYVKSKNSTADERFKVFLMGYLTAVNTLSEDTYNVTGTQPLDTALVWLTDYCGAHQMDSFDRAVQQMVDARFEQRQRVPPGRERGWGRAGPAAPLEGPQLP
ncbi:MAG: hypothetical protein ACU85U_06680 [Gammaproteobacteria bacterium]